MTAEKKKATGYDKYIDWKVFIFPVVILFLILLLPATKGMRDVGTEYGVGPQIATENIAQTLFGKQLSDLEQWQVLTCQIMEKSTHTGAMTRARFLKRDIKWCKSHGIAVDKVNLARAMEYVDGLADESYEDAMRAATHLRMDELNYNDLTESEKQLADKSTWKLKVALAVMVFTVFCFITGCIPLPAVAFCIGIIFTFSGVVSRVDVAALYWSDAVWFIMGSLMFAAAFVKTGVDRRICLMLFDKLARPSVAAVSFVMILVIAPLAAFVSDHALAAIFLPIAIILHRGSQSEDAPDMELG